MVNYCNSSLAHTLPSHTSDLLDCIHLAKLQPSQIQLHLFCSVFSCLLGAPLSARKNVSPRRAGLCLHRPLCPRVSPEPGVSWRHVRECACPLHGFLSEAGEGSESSFMVGLPWWLGRSRIHLQCGRPGLHPWVGKIPWRGQQLPTPVFLPGEFPRTEDPGGVQSMGSQRAWTQLSD